MKVCMYFVFLFSFVALSSQDTVKVHSHNDYHQNTPFWGAFAAGANSIEVDLVLQNDTLYVAHEKESINPNFVFGELYLKPLRKIAKVYGTSRLNFQLMIDVKTEAESTLDKIVKAIEPYKDLCQPNLEEGVIVTISGNRPQPKKYLEYPEHIYFDCQEINQTQGEAWNRVAMISTSFKNFSKWNGLGRMVADEKKLVEAFIDKVKQYKKPVRLWATPDTKTSWKHLSQMGVDYINTDTPERVVPYLKSLSKRTYMGQALDYSGYEPTFAHDGNAQKIKNIIFMIGDGMGLSQLSSGDLLNGNLHITKLKTMGLVRTQAADNFGTDSAAGATAYATGIQTNNRAIGTDTEGKRLENITEILSQKNYTTALVTTDHITGATPSAFYAHVKDRGEDKTIANHLLDSNIDFFASAGKSDFKWIMDKLETNFLVYDSVVSIQFPKDKRVGVFFSEGGLTPVKEGRGKMMPQLVKKVLPYLKSKGNPFFIMIEGANIDSYGHANNTDALVQELFDFDAMVAEALKFADTDGETLVVITADHETGGFSLLDGDIKNGILEGDFTTHDHTGTLVPLFAYGPGAYLFRGTYPNFQVNHRLRQLLGIKNILKN